MRDEDEDEGRRVKGLCELIRAEGMMIEGVDGRELPFTKRLLREETKGRYNVLFGHTIERERSIGPIHSLLLVCLPMHYFLNINAFHPRPISFFLAEFARKADD